MMKPLRFTDSQMRQLQRAAATLPVGRRDAFLRAVAKQLGAGTPAMPAVVAAIRGALDRVSTSIFLCDAQPKGADTMSSRHQHEDADDDAFDERGLLRDGARLHVPMFAMDGMQQAIARESLRVTDGQGGVAGLHQPGFRIFATDATSEAMRARDAAYRDYEQSLTTAYKNPVGFGDDPSIRGLGERGTDMLDCEENTEDIVRNAARHTELARRDHVPVDYSDPGELAADRWNEVHGDKLGFREQLEAIRQAYRMEIAGKPVLSFWSDVLDYLTAAIAFAETERLHILFLDKRNRLITDEVQQRGTVDRCPVYPREVVKRALQVGATAIILSPQPSFR